MPGDVKVHSKKHPRDHGGVQDLHRSVEIDRTEYFRNAGDIPKYRQYVDGLQDTTLTEGQKALLQNLLVNKYCDNVAHQIVAEDADRIELKGWKVEPGDVSKGQSDGVVEQKYLDDLWMLNDLDDLSGETTYNALRDGDYALLVEWDNDKKRNRIYREPWWDGKTGVFIAYDEQGDPLYAIKQWQTFQGIRRVIWYEDRIERYESPYGGGAWVQFQLPADGKWPVAYIKEDDNPLHIPLIHFPNAGRSMKNYGRSELFGGVLAHQDHINDVQFDMMGCGRMTGFQMYWMAGVKLAKDSKQKDIPPKIGAGKIWHSEDPSARYGVLPPGNLNVLISLYMVKLKAVARMTRTPLHLITGGDWPSGEALSRAEMPLINKCRRQIKKFTACWATVAHRSMELMNVYGRESGVLEEKYGVQHLDETLRITPIFEDPARRDPMTVSLGDQAFWTAAGLAVQAGLPLDIFLKNVANWTDQMLLPVREQMKKTEEQTQLNIQLAKDQNDSKLQTAAASARLQHAQADQTAHNLEQTKHAFEMSKQGLDPYGNPIPKPMPKPYPVAVPVPTDGAGQPLPPPTPPESSGKKKG